jgi:hypothetical protein
VHTLGLIIVILYLLFEMKSYVKVIGPPVAKTIKALEKIAVDMPEVCIMSTPIEASLGIAGIGFGTSGVAFFESSDGINSYFEAEISEERCNTIISKSGETLGEYDFYFEWFKTPKMDELMILIEKIDEAVTKTGAKYTITTK